MKKFVASRGWTLLLGWLLLLPIRGAAQTPPDEEEIFDRTTTASSPYYYPNLWIRYNSGDTTLTVDDYRYLYYGYAFRDEYKPLSPNEERDRMMLIVSRIDPDKPRVEDLEALILSGLKALELDPFSPNLLNLMAYAYGALGNREQEEIYYDRMEKVLAAIKSSGDALTQRTPQHILMFGHALDVIASEGLTPGKSRVVSRTTEYVPLVAPTRIDDRKVKGFYFDYSRIYRNKPEGYTFKRERTWQFNNLKPREYK